MWEPNAWKVVMLYPVVSNDRTPFDPEIWDWWLRGLFTFGAYHEFATRGTWEGQSEDHLCVTMVGNEHQVQQLEEFVQEARERFQQKAMYFEVTRVYFRLI